MRMPVHRHAAGDQPMEAVDDFDLSLIKEDHSPNDATEAKRAIANCLGALDERESRFVTLRYGLDGKGPRSLRQISEMEGLSKERVRQVVDLAVKKMRESMEVGQDG